MFNKMPIVAVMGLISSLVLASCAVYSHSTFSRWSGPAIFRGTGGTVRSVNGIDIWANGAPDRRFRLLGFLEQANLNDDSALAILANVTSDQSLVADAKKAGGDAIILVSANTQFLGYNASIDYGAAYAGPYSGQYPWQVHPMTSANRQVAVIKYL